MTNNNLVAGDFQPQPYFLDEGEFKLWFEYKGQDVNCIGSLNSDVLKIKVDDEVFGLMCVCKDIKTIISRVKRTIDGFSDNTYERLEN